MTVFLLTPEVRERAREVAAFARAEANWYRPGDCRLPGDIPGHVLVSGSVRAVFSWTVAPHERGLFRHLSVSVRREGRYPLPQVVWTLAHLLGFTGASPGEGGLVEDPAAAWAFDVNEEESTAVVVERVEELDGR